MNGSITHALSTTAGQLASGLVLDITESGFVVVELGGETPAQLRCDILVTTEGPPPILANGDQVLVWIPTDGGNNAVVLGRIGASQTAPEHGEVPETVLIEARQSLTFKCGSGSITIREDGKILIKGKDLVSHAKRLNRIRGGSVQIN